MVIRLQRWRDREFDHELVWSLVGLSCLIGGFVWLELFGPPRLACPVKTVTGLPCPSCGATRCALALARGDVGAALRLQPGLFALVALSCVYIPYALTVVIGRLPRVRVRLSSRERLALRVAVPLAFVALWVFLVLDGR